MKHHVADRREAGFSVVEAPRGWKPEADSWSGPPSVVATIAAVLILCIILSLALGVKI